jgi:hypothetical protein
MRQRLTKDEVRKILTPRFVNKDKEVHRDWLKAKQGEEGFRKLESGSER